MIARIVFSPYIFDSIDINLAPSADQLPQGDLDRHNPQWYMQGASAFWVRTDNGEVAGIYTDFAFDDGWRHRCHQELLLQIAGEQLYTAARKLYEDNKHLSHPWFPYPPHDYYSWEADAEDEPSPIMDVLPYVDVEVDAQEYANIQEFWKTCTVPA